MWVGFTTTSCVPFATTCGFCNNLCCFVSKLVDHSYNLCFHYINLCFSNRVFLSVFVCDTRLCSRVVFFLQQLVFFATSCVFLSNIHQSIPNFFQIPLMLRTTRRLPNIQLRNGSRPRHTSRHSRLGYRFDKRIDTKREDAQTGCRYGGSRCLINSLIVSTFF